MGRQPTVPGPPAGFLGLSVARQFSRDPLAFTEQMVREYGPLVELRLGPIRAYLAADPAAVQEVLITHSRSFRKERRTRRAVRQIDGEGIITTEGDFWLRQRRLVQKGFVSEQLASYANVTSRRVETMLATWPQSGKLEICNEMTCLTLAVIAETMFQVDLAAEAQTLADQVEYLSERLVVELSSAIPLPDWLPTAAKRRKRSALNTLHSMVRDIVSTRRLSSEDRGDMLSILLSAVDSEGDGGRMTDQQVCDEITTLFVAGYDTTASGLAWTWYLLAEHPEIAELAAAEATAVLGDRAAVAEDYDRLPLIRQIIQESLRLYPPAWMLMLREAAEDTQLLGHSIRRGSWVYLVPWVTHRSERWFADPLKFDPRRFAPDRIDAMVPHSYYPFGLGGHRCIGERLALLEMTLTVATILRRFRIRLAADQGPVEVEPHTAIRPKGGLRVQIDAR